MLNKYQLCDFFLSFFLTWLQTVAHWWRCNAWLLQWRRFPQDRQPDSVSPTLETPNRRSSNIDVFLYNNSRTAAKRAKTTHEIFFFRSRSTFSFMIKKKKKIIEPYCSDWFLSGWQKMLLFFGWKCYVCETWAFPMAVEWSQSQLWSRLRLKTSHKFCNCVKTLSE